MNQRLLISVMLLISSRAYSLGTGSAHRSPETRSASVPSPAGIYVLDDASNEKPTGGMYAAGLFASPAYKNDITGHAIFVPIAKILPAVTSWGQFNWDWRVLDTLLQLAVGNGKKFSIELETGYQSSTTYLGSLPAGLRDSVGPGNVPLFDVWTTGGAAGRCISAYLLLPWVPRVQQFWSAAAFALAAHLKTVGVYDSLTLVHIPGLSVYDEEIRLPTGIPKPTAADTLPCPDGRHAYPTVITDADTAHWRSLGYSDTATINGFRVIAKAFADAFPDRVLALSLFPPAQKGIDFPNLTGDTVGYVATQIVREVTALARGRVEIQADDLDGNYTEAEVRSLAALNGDIIGWQSNKHGGAGAGCDGGGTGSCGTDGPSSPYFQLLQNGALTGGEYVEVWSSDVVNYPLSFATARTSGYYAVTGIPLPPPRVPDSYGLSQNYPNPFNPATTIRYEIPRSGFVTLRVFDMIGREVATLVHGYDEAGSHGVKFDGSQLPSGVYSYRIQSGAFSQTRTMVLIK